MRKVTSLLAQPLSTFRTVSSRNPPLRIFMRAEGAQTPAVIFLGIYTALARPKRASLAPSAGTALKGGSGRLVTWNDTSLAEPQRAVPSAPSLLGA